VTAVDA